MIGSIRILDTGLKPARWNVAMTAALTERHAEGAIGDCIRFHRYASCVLVGRSEDVVRASDVSHCRAQGIEIARRVTGGGAVYMSPRMLAWDAIVDRATFGDAARLTRIVCSGVAAGLARHGAPARFREPNDVEINGRKVSGAAGYVERRSAVLQGTVLIEDDVGAMGKALRIPEAALRERVTSLEAVLGRAPAVADIRESILAELVRVLGRIPVRDRVRRGEVAHAERLLQCEIGTDAFVMGDATQLPARGAA